MRKLIAITTIGILLSMTRISVAEEWVPWDFDFMPPFGEITKPEVTNAIQQYFNGFITKEQLMQVISLFYHWRAMSYDINGDGILRKNEVMNTIQDYFNGLIEQWQLEDVIETRCYQLRSPCPCCAPIDINNDCIIDKNEVINVINDYFFEDASKQQVIEVLNWYFDC